MPKIKRLNEDYRSSRNILSNSIKKFIDTNKSEIDHLASEYMWDEIYSMLADSFPEEDEEILQSEFNQIYGAPLEEDGEDDEMDHRNTSKVSSLAYPGMGKISMGSNQKLTESKIKRFRNF
jgi:hypothetical protein